MRLLATADLQSKFFQKIHLDKNLRLTSSVALRYTAVKQMSEPVLATESVSPLGQAQGGRRLVVEQRPLGGGIEPACRVDFAPLSLPTCERL